MRYLLLSILSVALLGCQSQIQQPDPPEITPQTPVSVSPQVVATLSATEPGSIPDVATLSVATPTSIPEAPNPTLMVTQTGQPEAAATPDQCSVYPAEAAPAVSASGSPDSDLDVKSEPFWGYRIVNVYPHDVGAYTQGLVIEDSLSTLLEGTGKDSCLRRVDLLSGEIQQYYDIQDEYFGEGITKFDDRIIQLTWQQQTGFVYDQNTFDVLEVFNYPHEGWGITHDGKQLIVSDGTDKIRFWDPQTFQEVRRIQVTGESGPVTQLNELEYVDGEIWANVWFTDVIVRISPDDGRVLGWIDLSGLLSPYLRLDSSAVLNGIAYHEGTCRLFVTGKLWPALFEIEIVKPEV